MTLKQYTILRLSIVIVLAVFISQCVLFNNYVLPIIGIAVASLLLLYFRGKVDEVISDERDYQIGGRAALWTIQIFSWIATIGFFAFYAFGNPISYSLAYMVCFLLMLYSFIFRLMDRSTKSTGRIVSLVLNIAFLIALIVMGGIFFYNTCLL